MISFPHSIDPHVSLNIGFESHVGLFPDSASNGRYMAGFRLCLEGCW